ncbi:uncharacterized protein LOC109858110 isoform X1 [Pseudomyrmex gracilis]|uniref:uncharacterized protein LOC109858110 isoform X1 n=1 Tax=Pseudomyrmex gracilis TaxID=219809 RepID=UPI00099565BF|nr:uncharacterized protein LOC109858110 isoform X1 [Pseudomyrmex gracilis]XP_020290643.1 uncharacterized protein LOC109858110 isoform X1 [Pseudomyrmex gracilis]XP_020290652.1 uncharacterized protein LOC109858110 isoform X1 [Pseudomyrmex gracilis]XP_020290661.1 uncharacterized protein LOC109858110 isoform X1 [Pseudomyrmex gracilis]XP_020290672.1 uncharacterized protein LOC109858110 isoform X1 [Pseudomyrmex gracilis]
MDSEVFFQEYAISEKTVARLESIREALKDNIIRANPMWKLLAGENKEEMCSEDEDNDEDDKSNNSESQLMFDQLMPSTQFYFTQVERIIEKPKRPVDTVMQKCDILESVCENLERNNGRMNFAQLENLSSDDFVLLVDELTKKLSLKGIYNLCQSMMNDMTVQQEMKYLNTLCTHLLLPKIMRFALRSRRGPHVPIGHDAKKSLKKEIERRIEVIPRIQYEPQLISDSRYILTPGGQAPPHYYRLKAVDDVKTLEAEITKYDNCLKRHPSENLRAYLLTTLATPLNGSGQRLIHQFCDLYEHARHDPTEFGDEEYQVYTRLYLKLMDAARLLKSYPNSRKSSPSRTPIKKTVETKRNILEPRMHPPEEQILSGSRPNTLTVMALDNSETSV